MDIFVVDNCFWCIPLKTGSFIFAYLRVIVDVIIFPMVMTTNFDAVRIGLGLPLSEGEDKQLQSLIIFGILVFLFVHLFFDIVLLVGLHMNKPTCVRSYVVFSVFIMLGSAIAFTSQLIRTDNDVTLRFGTSMLSQLYIILVLRSYYLKMVQPEQKLKENILSNA